MTMLLNKYMRMLPIEIILYIIPYTYLPQPNILLSDIHNYVKTREIITKIYYNKYEDLLQYEKNADKNWLVSDILLFIKQNNTTDVYRSIILNIYNEFIFTKKNINSQFNIFWSMLSIENRNKFIELMKPKPKRMYVY